MKSAIISRTLQSLAPRARIARVIVAVAFAGLFAAGCKSSTDAAVVTALTISPTTVTLAQGGTQQFTVVAKNSAGDVLVIPNPTWSVTAGGGTITSTGLYTAGTTAGTFTVSVTCSGITATASVIVSPGALLTITVTPNPVTLVIGATQTFTAVGRDASGNVVVINPSWSVTAGGGSIPNGTTGLTAPFTAGNTTGTFPNTVRATQGAIFGTATVNVIAGPLFAITVTPNPDTLAVGAQQQFTAVGKDAGGNVVPIPPPLVWSVVDPLAGTIISTSGLFTAGTTPNTYPNTIKATSGAISGFATVVVTPPPAAPLATANPFGILAGSTITCVTGGIINADIGLSPGSAVVLGTPPCVVTGTQHITDAVAAQAQLDLTTAYNALVALPCGTVIGTADIGATTKTAGVYCSGSTIGVTGALTLDGGGDANATFVFQAGSGLTGVGTIVLINGAQAKNVWWQVGSSATIGVGSAWKGNILAFSSITLNDNVTLIGRALARNGAVTLGTGDTITLP
jgi:hypothetical protein